MPATAVLSSPAGLASRPAVTSRPAASRTTCRPVNALYRWRPSRAGVAPAVDAWAGSCCSPSEAWRQSWAGLESMAREFEEGSTGLLDPSPSTMRQQAGFSRRTPTRPLPFDVIEQADQVMLMFDVPGVARSDVQVKVSQENVLTITVERKPPQSVHTTTTSEGAAAAATASSPSTTAAAHEGNPAHDDAAEKDGAAAEKQDVKAEKAEEAQQTVVRLERPYGRFTRSIRLGKTVDADRIAAKLEEGVLTLTIPKMAKQEPASININIE